MRAEDLWTQESNRAQAATALASLARLHSQAGELEKARKEIEDALGFFEASRAANCGLRFFRRSMRITTWRFRC